MIYDKVVRTWLEYGEHDLLTAQTMSDVHPRPLEIIAFHYQQAAEKCLKAALFAYAIPVPKVHDLLRLNRLLAPSFPEIVLLESECDRLSDFGTIARYPNESIMLDDAKIGLAEMASRNICDLVRKKLLTAGTPQGNTALEGQSPV